MTFHSGQQLLSSDLNKIISKLYSRIEGGNNINVRTFGGSIIIEKESTPKKTGVGLLIMFPDTAGTYNDFPQQWNADLAGWNDVYKDKVPDRVVVHICDVVADLYEQDNENVAPYGWPEGLTYSVGFPRNPITTAPFIDVYNKYFTSLGYEVPSRVILHIRNNRQLSPGIDLFVDWLEGQGIMVELNIEYLSRWLNFTTNYVVSEDWE